MVRLASVEHDPSLALIASFTLAGDQDAGDSKKTMEVLAPVDHAQIQYEAFRKCLYTPHADVAAMTEADVAALRRELAVRVDGSDVPRPVQSFMHLGVDRKLLARLLQLGLEVPTAIQAQAFPVALAGRDMIGIAKTGSGKTLAFTLPMVRHVMGQRALRKGDGPIAVVLAPTRELAHQIFTQVKRFISAIGGECAAIYGGVGKWEQIQAVRRGAEVVVATPGRLIELIRKRTVAMTRVTFVVLDEADRMFEMGFEPQLRSVLSQIRPDRQTLLFSATFQRRIEVLARDVLTDPVKVAVGHVGQANEEIRQVAVVVPNDSAKWPWLLANLPRIAADGRVLIFAASKLGCETLAKNVAAAMGVATACLHGDKTQQERSDALSQFKTGACRVLVATDVAARGLDVKDIKTVVNFDVAKTIDIHVHRIGRTGRMGLDGFEPGTAYTLVTMKESLFAAHLVHNMDVSKQPVAPDLLALASRDARFRRRTPGGASGTAATVKDLPPMAREVSSGTSGSREHRDGDNASEDAEEMERWHESRRTSQAALRKGLGFAGAAGGTGRGFRGSRTPSAAALSSSFQSAFVKATTAASAPSAASVETLSSHRALTGQSQPPAQPPVPQWSAPSPSPAAQASASAQVPTPAPLSHVPPEQQLLPESANGVGAPAIPEASASAPAAATSGDVVAPASASSAPESSTTQATRGRTDRDGSRGRSRSRRSRTRSPSRSRRRRSYSSSSASSCSSASPAESSYRRRRRSRSRSRDRRRRRSPSRSRERRQRRRSPSRSRSPRRRYSRSRSYDRRRHR